MVKQQRRTDRCFIPAAGNSGTRGRVPVGPAHRRQQVHGSTTTEEERGEPGPDGGPGETKRARLDGTEEAAALTNRERAPGSCGQPAAALGSNQQAAEPSDDSRAAEPVRSLKVTIQQSSESREFRQTDRTSERQTGELHCHVCELSCCSLQVFQEHMTGSEHLRKLKEMTHSICLNTHTLQDRGRRPEAQRWCDTCQTHFSDDIIVHRRTKQHKMCKQLCRPFCPVCKRHFRTPRSFVEHMKSEEHKQVHLEAQEELITVDAVGCFKEEEEEVKKVEEKVEEEEEEKEKKVVEEEEKEEEVEEEEKEEEVVVVVVEEEEEEEEVEVAEEEDGGQEAAEDRPTSEAADTQETEEYDPDTTYGSSFVLPVSGFLCQLCNKFFYKETTARHTHCRTHTHYLNLQGHRARRRREGRSALS